jgi:hypothetical protein
VSINAKEPYQQFNYKEDEIPAADLVGKELAPVFE